MYFHVSFNLWKLIIRATSIIKTVYSPPTRTTYYSPLMNNRVYCKCLFMTMIEFPPFFHFSHQAHICWPPGFDKRSLWLAHPIQALSAQDSSKDGYRLNNGLPFQTPQTQMLRADRILVVGHRIYTKNNYKLLWPQMQTIMTRMQGSGLLNRPQLTFTCIRSISYGFTMTWVTKQSSGKETQSIAELGNTCG